MKTDLPKLVSVAIPTKDRPKLLHDAIESVEAQLLPPGLDIEIVVIDNSSDGSARDVCEAHGNLVRYVHSPIPGLSNARNRAVSESRGEFIAFLDDDEVAEPVWLSKLCEALTTTGSDAAFGAVEPEFETEHFELQEYARHFYRRRVHATTGEDISNRYYQLGTGNSCFVKARCFSIENPFQDRFNASGGEDIMLLKDLVNRGHRFVWAPEACVRERTPATRCNFAYLLKRRFRNGQIRCWVLIEGTLADKLRIVFLMASGGAQILLGAIGAAYWSVARSSKAKEQVITIAAGAGKLLWILRPKEKSYV
ncbi:glycosyltransferase [Methylocystis bryophila]|uniref:Glycosyltransferase 2-like domain-containing protein n=1 Tax=Methylocystis bryophila TaxID=655015 RepID=A0A1W6MVA2_9HYPH|nr:glycosyltransferase family 2 protein [Methylocystis bryophila]ARN81497.1 hypothetical protein B1812_10920 [Methylocystis bryophila]BDV37519.1 glycosyl transferase [Methylocystis bryophila]